MSQTGLFGADALRVWTIPPGTDFLGQLARTLAEETGLSENPAGLADSLIYVPNRRSARALAAALYMESGGRTILPPDIRALGDLEVDDPPSGAEEALTDLGPALPSARRLGVLSALVTSFYEQRGITLPPVSAISAARELSRLLDSAALSGNVDWTQLPDLVEDSDLASHWSDSVKFLRIVTDIWPNWLQENGATEPFERRLIVARAIAAAVLTEPPKGLFLIAGSTGATPASRVLMKAATGLARGLVVLPGLDRDAPANMWREVAERPEDGFPGEPDHPQFSLAGTLRTLGLTAATVPVWPGANTGERAMARQRLVHESLAPAKNTADWLDRLRNMAGAETEAVFARKALTGLAVVEAADQAEEALLAALALREALETPDQTAALVTPDATLARQVATLLTRWEIKCAPSGGIPLGRTLPGSLILLALDWAQDTGNPVALASLLKHPLVKTDKQAALSLETSYLRGPRRWQDLGDLVAQIPKLTDAANESRHTQLPPNAAPDARGLLEPLVRIASAAACFAPENTLENGPMAVESLARLVNALTGDETSCWSGKAGEAASRCLETISDVTETLSGLTPSAFADISEAMAAGITVPDPAADHPRLAIWGPLEARLQHADRIVLAGLNEGVWPDQPAADAFLPRRFRAPLGLSAPEARLGLAAHDFAQLAASPNVLMLYSARRDDAPAVASRWLLRLKTLTEGALGDTSALDPDPDHDPRPWADTLREDRQSADQGFAKPHPAPPVDNRPNQLSVTRINTLQRDPYTIYAGDILKLKKLDILDAPMDARPRGTAIHAALEDFEKLSDAQQNANTLHQLFLTKLAEAGETEHQIIGERAGLAETAASYVDWWRARKDEIKTVWPEVRGHLTVDIEGTPFKLTGIADRVEQHKDGSLAIIDFKTGAGKKRKQIDAGFEQQLPLLGAMAREGTFENVPAGPVSDFGYVSVRFNFEAPALTYGPEDAMALSEQSVEILTRLIAAYRQPDAPYLSVPRIVLKADYAGDYDRLARRAEWAGDTSDD